MTIRLTFSTGRLHFLNPFGDVGCFFLSVNFTDYIEDYVTHSLLDLAKTLMLAWLLQRCVGIVDGNWWMLEKRGGE